MSEKNNNTFMGALAEEHIRESEQLKRAWFDHVLSSLEKLGENVDRLSSELHASKDNLYKEIIKTKENIRKELNDYRNNTSVDLEKVEKRIEKILDELNIKIKDLSVQAVKDELKRDIEKLKEDKIGPLSDSILALKVKIAVWGITAGIIGNIIVLTAAKYVFSIL